MPLNPKITTANKIPAMVPDIPSIFHYAIRIKQLHTSSALNSRIQVEIKG